MPPNGWRITRRAGAQRRRGRVHAPAVGYQAASGDHELKSQVGFTTIPFPPTRRFIREYLCVTVSMDHDIIDGAPAARFVQRLKELVEGGYGLE
jgi:hypothetical protein